MSNKKRPLILVSNDDGITAKGIRVLVEVMCELGEVVVVAPDSPQSGMGHAITIHSPLKLFPSPVFSDLGVEAYHSSGTPADCIKLAKHEVLAERKPDIVVSGINHGSNTSVSVLYSGTMSAAMEAAMSGLNAIGFSLCDYGHDADFSHVRALVKKITSEALSKGLPEATVMNVNFPAAREEPILGVKICRQAQAAWHESVEKREDPYGRPYYWLSGKFINPDKGEDTDEWAIAHNYASIVPCEFDLTAHHAIGVLNEKWEL
ncbi:MAG: 5'/3'-nucleotidase SurE [Bernardetiaceae bacterium]|nr:5'/3'-nucleotidase SurE [Bernardetiaceae bacterium]